MLMEILRALDQNKSFTVQELAGQLHCEGAMLAAGLAQLRQLGCLEESEATISGGNGCDGCGKCGGDCGWSPPAITWYNLTPKGKSVVRNG